MASHVYGKFFWVACSGIGGFKVCEPSWNDATTNQSILLFYPHIYQSFSGIAMQKCTNWWMIPGLYGVLIS